MTRRRPRAEISTDYCSQVSIVDAESTGRADAAEHLGLSGKDAGEQKEPLEQLLLVVEGDGQQSGLERNTVGRRPKRSDPAGRS